MSCHDEEETGNCCLPTVWAGTPSIMITEQDEAENLKPKIQ